MMTSDDSHPAAVHNIVLTGFMGTGKSTVGRLLAERLGWLLVDMDAMIETREQRTISDIFARDGETAFRAIERRLVRELSDGRGRVIATGGGVVLNPDNVDDFERSGLLVCLDASPERILERVAHETHRPLLAASDKLERIRDLMDKRQTAYARVGFHLDTDRLTPTEVADRIVAVLPA